MKCPQCGQGNKEQAQFCISCGEELTNTGKVVYCIHCGKENTDTANYCAACGEKIIKSSPPKKPESKSRKQTSKTKKQLPQNNLTFGKTMALVVGLFVIIIIAVKIFEAPTSSQSARTDIPTVGGMDPFLTSQVSEVASKFYCNCGGCNKEPLEECTCETAMAEKQFIRDAFKDGKQKDQIIASLVQTYGGLEPEFQDQYNR